ncbi:MAG: acetyl-CoA carboxylase carboxyltransferase subunit beta [Candidatus Izimaplasma sp.]|nr:acetyl-CoA carboxylase carboxyltransferase subunit beta [Candidatus Izimaplasma bacterium]
MINMNNLIKTFESRRNLKSKYKIARSHTTKIISKIDVPIGLYEQCPKCKETINMKNIVNNDFVCKNCGEHFRIRAVDRLKITVDPNSFVEKGHGYITLNPLFQDGYEEKIASYKEKTSLDEAYIYGYAEINSIPIVIGIMDSYFLMGSMGSVVGEKVTKSFEYAMYKKLPIIIFTASGGARMQEGIFSLMQMAKTSQAVLKHSKMGLLYITVLTDPTTGGVTASFASLGDIILAEPNALIGFAGPRVIEQTINQKLPKGFQRSEFLEEKGFVDKVVNRHDLKEMLSQLLILHWRK